MGPAAVMMSRMPQASATHADQVRTRMVPSLSFRGDKRYNALVRRRGARDQGKESGVKRAIPRARRSAIRTRWRGRRARRSRIRVSRGPARPGRSPGRRYRRCRRRTGRPRSPRRRQHCPGAMAGRGSAGRRASLAAPTAPGDCEKAPRAAGGPPGAVALGQPTGSVAPAGACRGRHCPGRGRRRVLGGLSDRYRGARPRRGSGSGSGNWGCSHRRGARAAERSAVTTEGSATRCQRAGEGALAGRGHQGGDPRAKGVTTVVTQGG